MDCVSTDSVEDLSSSSDEEAEDVEKMARCLARQLVDSIPIPTAERAKTQNKCRTPRPNQPPFPTFSQRHFYLGRGNSPLVCDESVRNNHPITIYCSLIPQVYSPLLVLLQIEDRTTCQVHLVAPTLMIPSRWNQSRTVSTGWQCQKLSRW